MEPAEFRRWRKWMGLSQKETAAALGLKRRVVQYYEKGERDGEPLSVPRSVWLACHALANGVSSYHGPSEEEAAVRQEERALEKKVLKKARRLQKEAEKEAVAALNVAEVSDGEGQIPEKITEPTAE